MAILIDPPAWPAHSTTFSHLVSDTSLGELHEFAERNDVSHRAFDLDHYDVPAHRYGELVAAGAVPVTGGALIRALRASGLRVPARARPAKVRAGLLARWERTLPRLSGLGEDLLTRWSEPHRRYHDTTHLLAVLDSLDHLTGGATPRPVALAAWFHDAVYEGVAHADEEASAELAVTALTSAIGPEEAAEVARLVLVTIDHRPDPQDRAGALLSDADLAVLGSTPADYERYVTKVRQDYAHTGEARWRAGRARVLTSLLELTPLFHTDRGAAAWESAARRNLTRELDRLR